MDLRDAYFVDGCRTWFGKSRPDGIYWTTRADDMVTKILVELQKRNPTVPWGEVDDCIWGATTQAGDQGTGGAELVTVKAAQAAGQPGRFPRLQPTF